MSNTASPLPPFEKHRQTAAVPAGIAHCDNLGDPRTQQMVIPVHFAKNSARDTL